MRLPAIVAFSSTVSVSVFSVPSKWPSLNCSAEVQVIPKPMPNEIAIGGTAVAINCEVIHVS